MMLSLQVGKANIEQILAARLIPLGLMQLHGSKRQGKVPWCAQGPQAIQGWSRVITLLDILLFQRGRRERGCQRGLHAGPVIGCSMDDKGLENDVPCALEKDPIQFHQSMQNKAVTVARWLRSKKQEQMHIVRSSKWIRADIDLCRHAFSGRMWVFPLS